MLFRSRLPNSKLLVLGVFPRGETPSDSLRKLNDKTNQLIAPLADNKQVFFLDISKSFLDSNGNLPADIMPDRLHPNRKGYELWAQAIDGKLGELLK